MAERSIPVNRRWRLTQSALWRWILFFAIVWSIAGAFVLLNSTVVGMVSFLSAAGLALSNPAPPLNSVAAAKPIDHCKEALEQWGRTHSTKNLTPEVRKYSSEFAWRMGFEVGRVAGPLAMGLSTVADTQQYLATARQLAAVLQVPGPTLPKVNQSLRATVEFAEFVESDPRCIAAQLVQNFSPQQEQLFKFGEALGFSTAYRIKFPEGGNRLGPLVRHHGGLADLPQTMWIGFVQETKAPLPGSDVNAKFNGVLQPFHEYFSCQRDNGKSCSVTVHSK